MAILFLAGAFVTGSAVGYAAERVTRTPEAPKADERSARQELANELQLTATQQVVFDSAFAWRRARSRDLMAPIRPALDAVRDSARTMMLNSLDSSQQAAFRRLIERNQRTADSIAKARGETK
jgi:hypothetical protein